MSPGILGGVGLGRVQSQLQASSRPQQREGVLRMEADWGRVTVVDVKPAAEGLFHVHINTEDLLSSYQVPGQYVQVSRLRSGSRVRDRVMVTPWFVRGLLPLVCSSSRMPPAPSPASSRSRAPRTARAAGWPSS